MSSNHSERSACSRGASAPEAPASACCSISNSAWKKPVVLFFHVSAFGNFCTQEALAFQLDLPKFAATDTQVLGVRGRHQ